MGNYIGSGLGGQLGLAEEATVGTAQASDHFYEIISEGIKARKKEVFARGIRAGRMYDRGAGRYITQRDATGDVPMWFPVRKCGLLLRHMLGSPVVRPTKQASGAYQQVHVPGLTLGKSLSVQEGIPPVAGAAPEPFTYPGSKIIEWEISCAQSDLLQLKLTFDSWDELTAVTTPASPTLATAVYPLGGFFVFTQGVLKQGGTPSTTTTAAPTTPAAPGVSTAGTAGSTSRYYKVSQYNATGDTIASTETVLTTGNATLSGTNYDVVTVVLVTGATGSKVWWGTTPGGENQFVDIGSATTWNNQGSAGTAGTPPTVATAVATTSTSIAGGTTTAAVRAIKINGKNGLKTDNYFLGSGTTKGEQNQNAVRELTGTIDVEFQTRAALYDLYRSDSSIALELTFTGTAIPGTSPTANYTLDLVMPQIFLEDGASPTIAGPDVVMMSIPFKVTDDDVDTVIQATILNDDAAI